MEVKPIRSKGDHESVLAVGLSQGNLPKTGQVANSL